MKSEIIKELAKFLANNQAEKSVRLQLGDASAKEWARLRTVSNIPGWATVEETEKHLRKVFGLDE